MRFVGTSLGALFRSGMGPRRPLFSSRWNVLSGELKSGICSLSPLVGDDVVLDVETVLLRLAVDPMVLEVGESDGGVVFTALSPPAFVVKFN